MTAVERRVLAPFWYSVLALPGGMVRGFVSVTLAFYLRQHGIPFAAIAGMIGLAALPHTWKVLLGPTVDAVWTPAIWYALSLAIACVGIAGLGVGASLEAAMPTMGGLALLAGAASAITSEAIAQVMVQTSPRDDRGEISGWINAGLLGGGGIGGGIALWIASSATGGIALAGLAMALVTALCIAPLLWLRPPRVARGEDLKTRAGGVWRAVAGLLSTRVGLLVALFALAPTGLNEAANLMPALAGEWHAPAGMVALVSGVVGGLVTIPGCVFGGYLCRRFSPKAVYIGTSLACALVEVIIAFSPRTPTTFAALILVNAAVVGSNWAAIMGVAFEILGEKGAATVSSLLSSLSNVPIVAMAMAVGAMQQRFGVSGMFLSEAAIAAACLAGLGGLMLLWRERRSAWPAAEPAAAV